MKTHLAFVASLAVTQLASAAQAARTPPKVHEETRRGAVSERKAGVALEAEVVLGSELRSVHDAQLGLQRAGWAPSGGEATKLEATVGAAGGTHSIYLDKATVDAALKMVIAEHPGTDVWLGDATGNYLPDVTGASDIRVGLKFHAQPSGSYRGAANLIVHLERIDGQPVFSSQHEDELNWTLAEKNVRLPEKQWNRAEGWKPPTLAQRFLTFFEK